MAASNTKIVANNKVKGLLKGLRYISQIFENEDEEPEMQIGAPTDVKHVAHIGMDGQSANSTAPSWLNDFNSPAKGSEAREEKPAKYVTQDMPDVRKSSKRDKPKQSNKSSSSSKNSTCSETGSKPKKVSKDPSAEATESNSTSEDLTKKTGRRKKSKDVGVSRRKRTQDLDSGSDSET